ncbi:hypothetical protein LWC35_00195 [Pseudonocardia kujensis]|uniref:hypothetical protein n=1 Tax=Pseudonocardia kujensis TaxID=1128675 RepID=UPI001E5DAF59|nr:hypothetical protein [Pseudonocardia kujensis]MCE0761345.1 hypothetical protein [Pseudonocardia kujensis]
MIDDETRALRSVPAPRRPLDDLDDAPLGSPAPPLGTPGWPAGSDRSGRADGPAREDDATRVGQAPTWEADATRVGGWDAAATRVGAAQAWDATAVAGPVDPAATAHAGAPAVEATTAISARRQAELAAESPVDATTAIASVRPVFVDERGRRTRGIKFGVYSVVAVCVVFLAVVGISLAAGNRGPLMEIPLLGGASPAEASDTVDTNEIAPPPEQIAEAAPRTTTKAPVTTTTRAPARVVVPVAPVEPVATPNPAPTTTVAPAPTTVPPTTRTRPTRTQPAPTTRTTAPTTGQDTGNAQVPDQLRVP